MDGGGPSAASRPATPPRTAPPHRDPRRHRAGTLGDTEWGPSGAKGRDPSGHRAGTLGNTGQGPSGTPGRDSAAPGSDLVHPELSREKPRLQPLSRTVSSGDVTERWGCH